MKNLKGAAICLVVLVVILTGSAVLVGHEQKITGEQVESALVNDEAFHQVMSEFVHNLFRAQARKMPELYKKIIDLPFTKRNYLEARLLFWQNALASGFVAKMADATPAEVRYPYSKERYRELREWGYNAEVDSIKSLIKDIGGDNSPLDKKALFDSYLLNTSVGLNRANMVKYHKGELTIGDVLRTQPLVLITRHVTKRQLEQEKVMLEI